jgi:hypothetical protein
MGNFPKGDASRLIVFRGTCAADFSKPHAAVAPLFGEARNA